MVPVLLCILVLVLSSGAVLKVVLERDVEPTGETPPPPQEPEPIVAPQVPRVPPVGVAAGVRLGAPRALVPTLPRHRARSSALLIVLVVIVGILVATVIGTVLALLAFALRSTVTS